MIKSLKLAKKDAEDALILWPSWWKAYVRLAEVCMDLEDFALSKALLEKAIILNPTYIKAMQQLKFFQSQIVPLQPHSSPEDEIEVARGKPGKKSRENNQNISSFFNASTPIGDDSILISDSEVDGGNLETSPNTIPQKTQIEETPKKSDEKAKKAQG
uniref:Uncharacterized protein n=1 Tax=Panagrolaimus superbus TaxID=310955 RepID=A0A914Z1V1_9BILA